mmetsp:Transcript_6998/g.14343  ORF Transcript_6998/g.14343 Transcript_6998/m.14343 type:complete len:80 (+) Transcript_6998:850-1089(+)
MRSLSKRFQKQCATGKPHEEQKAQGELQKASQKAGEGATSDGRIFGIVACNHLNLRENVSHMYVVQQRGGSPLPNLMEQ